MIQKMTKKMIKKRPKNRPKNRQKIMSRHFLIKFTGQMTLKLVFFWKFKSSILQGKWLGKKKSQKTEIFFHFLKIDLSFFWLFQNISRSLGLFPNRGAFFSTPNLFHFRPLFACFLSQIGLSPTEGRAKPDTSILFSTVFWLLHDNFTSTSWKIVAVWTGIL